MEGRGTQRKAFDRGLTRRIRAVSLSSTWMKALLRVRAPDFERRPSANTFPTCRSRFDLLSSRGRKPPRRDLALDPDQIPRFKDLTATRITPGAVKVAEVHQTARFRHCAFKVIPAYQGVPLATWAGGNVAWGPVTGPKEYLSNGANVAVEILLDGGGGATMSPNSESLSLGAISLHRVPLLSRRR